MLNLIDPLKSEKTSCARENQQQAQPTLSVIAGIRTLTKLVEGGCSHHWAIPVALPIWKPVIVGGIQMKRLFSTENLQKIVISYEVLSFSCFWRNDRNSFYHLCGLIVSQKSQNHTGKSQLHTAFSITQWIPWNYFCNRSVRVQMLESRISFLLMFFFLKVTISNRDRFSFG